jgi:salicylate hydroxylase
VSDRLSVGIVGGGIGGLAAALSLLQRGFDVQVYEQAQEFGEVGAGIQVSPNASRILHRLGLADALARMGLRPLAWRQRRWDDGRTLLHTPLGDTVVEAFGFPHYQTHRADLLATLVRSLPPDRLHVGHRLVSFADDGDRVSLEFETGSTVEADALVGADGIHSTVQRLLLGEQRPRFTGCIAYRGLIPAERVADLRIPVEAQVWMGPAGISSTTTCRRNGCSTGSRWSSTTRGSASRGPTAARSPTPSPRTRAGTRRSGGSWRASTRRSSGRSSTARRWSAGRAGA